MKQLFVQHKNLQYEFRLLEYTNKIQVLKEGELAYTITNQSGLFNCDCPGAKYHHNCWHPSMISQLKQQPSITEPWAEWAEEVEEMKSG